MTTIRLGMFETNSSSMHSIVIKKNIENISDNDKKYSFYKFDDYDNRDYLGVKNTIYVDMTKERRDTHYCRQDGKLLMNSEDKLYFYLALNAYKIWDDLFSRDSNELPEVEVDVSKYEKAYEDFVKNLQRRLFDDLNIELMINPPLVTKKYYSWDTENKPHYEFQWLPDVEDSDEIFKPFLEYLEKDDEALRSFIMEEESFVLLAGDEYDTAFALENLILPGLREKKDNIEVMGSLKYGLTKE